MQMMPPGEAPEAKQFDFWVGEWEVTWDGGRGKNTIRKILDDRVIEESFDGTPSIPLVGRSLTVHNDQYGRWDQTWVDNQGSYLMFMGEWDDVDERMVLERDDMVGGKHIKQRMVFHNITHDALDWNWDHYQRMGDS
jgi:hypothetical protein